MAREIKVVIGSNYGDEGKGLVSYCLARDAVERGHRVLTVLYNGGVQRGHTAAGKVFHCTGTGAAVGSDTYYHSRFLVDPIALWLTGDKPIIHPDCRVVLPCDVINNRTKETLAGKSRHGSCGMGIFEASRRNSDSGYGFTAKDLLSEYAMYAKYKQIEAKYGIANDDLYNLHHFMLAAAYVVNNCEIASLHEIVDRYQTIIYEGGQGLLLDQANIGSFPYLTPSSVGSRNIHKDIEALASEVDVFYVSRTYMTRHGNGPMEHECIKSDINAEITDETNMPNEWQGSLRFGFLNPETLYRRIQGDMLEYRCKAIPNIVYTQTNYTDGKLATGFNKYEKIKKPDFIASIYGSCKKDTMQRIL